MSAWEGVERGLIDAFFRFTPAHARAVGNHAYDGVVADASATAIAGRIQELERQLEMLSTAEVIELDRAIDRRALSAQLEASRYELAELRLPFSDPLYYAGYGSELDVSPYLKRNYAPSAARLESLRQHLDGYAGYLEAARDNLESSLARPNLEVAIEAIDGQAAFLDGEARRFASADPAIQASIDRALDVLRDFAAYLRSRVPDSHDQDPLGRERFERILHLREMVTLDLPAIARLVSEDVERNSARAAELAGQIAPGEGVAGAMSRLEANHPSAESIIDDVSGMLESIRDFVLERDLLSLPSEDRCIVKATPSYATYVTAALDPAGPLETAATESYYYITLPAAGWGPARSEEWLRHLNYPVLTNISIHEAYPGHYVQSLHERRALSDTRRVFWVQGTGEGYAHYCESLMIEAGFSSDPGLQLAQVMDALLRDARALVAIGLHCQGMTMPEAVELFRRVAHLSELPASREASRGAWDPLYLTYTLGKLLIQDMRRERERRPDFSLRKFHDAFLQCGNLPIPLIGELIA